MIRLEGAHLPLEARGAVPPILFGDLLQDVPGIPLQIGWTAVLADNCGIAASGTSVLRLGGADLAETLTQVAATGTVQLENEWIGYSAIMLDPPRLTIAARGVGATVPAEHPKGTTVTFIETKPIYVFAYVPPGCTYPDDAVVQLRVNGNAEVTPATVRLQDDRLVPGVRLLTVEFDARRGFYAVTGTARTGTAGGTSPVVGLPSSVALTSPAEPGGALKTVHTYVQPPAGPPAPGAPPPPRVPPPAPTAAGVFQTRTTRTITLRSAALGTVTADLRGLRDTDAGRYSGVSRGPLVQPAAITRLLLEETYGETDPAQYHAPTWTATAAAHAARALTWRLVWAGETFETFREAAQACGQADLYLDDEGRWRYAFRAPMTPAVATLTARELLAEPALAWTGGRDVITELEVTWGAGVQTDTFTLDSPMRTRHGRTHGGVSLPYVATEASARALGTSLLARRDHPRQSLTVRAAPVTLPLTLGDWIYLDTPLLALYGGSTHVPFEIIGVTDRGDQRVFAVLEGDPLPAWDVAGVTWDQAGVTWDA